MTIMILASLPAFMYSLWQVLKKNYSVSEFSIVALGLSATAFFASMFTQPYFGMRGFIYSYFLMAILSVLSFKLFAERLDGFKAASSKFLSSKTIVNLKRLIVPLLLVFIALNIGIAFQAYPPMQNADVYSTEETVAGAAWVNATTSNLRITTTMDYASILYGSFNFNNLIFVPESQNRTSDVSQLLFWPQGQSDVVQVMSQYDIDSIVIGNRAIEFGFRYGREFRDPIPSSTVTYYEGFMNVVYSNGETTVYAK